MQQASIYLADGTHLHGFAAGHGGETTGELVFQTCHTGYEEVLTDPSYLGQIVVFTASHIGNTGITDTDHESKTMHAHAMICKELSRIRDNHRSRRPLDQFLKDQNKLALHGVDTRFLTQKLRDQGSMMAIISTEDHNPESLAAKLETAPTPADFNTVAQASTEEVYTVGPTNGPRLAVLDFGIKQGILDRLVAQGFHCTVMPWNTTASQIHALNPDGLFLSNGPGDPCYLLEHTNVVNELKTLIQRYPTFGICLGHQLLALACGGEIEKLRFGHHAANHPVREADAQGDAPVQVTSQNHNYAVVADSVRKQFEITHLHLNDQSVAGIRHKHLPLFSVQFHPESNPGPHDSRSLFTKFAIMVEAHACLAEAI